MTEESLSEQLDKVKAQRSQTPRYTEEWAALCVEMGRITAAIWRLRQDARRTKAKG